MQDLVQKILQPATPASALDGPVGWEIDGLNPAPEEEWERLKTFLNLSASDIQAMLHTVEALFRRGYELVVGNYDYLLQNPETAAILGWEHGVDERHLAERRRFFTVWLARTLGMDFSHDFARYLFRAGQIHAAHGPRHVHVPEVYVTGAISLVNATFARFLYEEMPGDGLIPTALAGWNKVLSLHLHLMLMGYRSAIELDRGEVEIAVSFFGRMRTALNTHQITLHVTNGETVLNGLRKLLNYYPAIRTIAFDPAWKDEEHLDTRGIPWLVVNQALRVRYGWRVLLNGRDVEYDEGLRAPFRAGDELQIFPPGR